MFELVEDADPAAVDAMLAGLAGLPDAIAEVRSFSVGRDAGAADGNLDVVVVVDFDDVEAWRRYQAHPAHQAVVADLVRPILRTRAAVQYELA